MFVTFVEDEHARLEDAPQLGPGLERAAHFQPVTKQHHCWVSNRAEQFFGRLLLLTAVSPLLGLQDTQRQHSSTPKSLMRESMLLLPSQMSVEY